MIFMKQTMLIDKVNKLQDWLINIYKNKKEGWPAVQIDDDIGTLTTGEALRPLILYSDFNLKMAENAIEYLLKAQNRSGGWPLIRERQLDSTLSSAEIIQTFIIIVKKYSPSLYPLVKKVQERTIKALKWLLNEQNEDGGFGYASCDRIEMDDIPNYKKSNLYATCIATLALNNAYNENYLSSDEYNERLKKASEYISSCRDTKSGFWKLFPTYNNTSLSLSALAIYVLNKTKEITVDAAKKYLEHFGFDRKDRIISLPIEGVPLQLPDGEVTFYINGAYWGLKFFMENEIPYAGVFSFLKYVNENNEFDYFRAQCFATERPYPQVVWFSIELYELLKLIEKNKSFYIEKSIVESGLFLSGIKKFDNTSKIISKITDLSTFYILIDECKDRDELIFIDILLQLLCELEIFAEKEDKIKSEIEKKLWEKISTIKNLENFEFVSNNFVNLKYTKIFDVNISIFKVLNFLSLDKVDEARNLFFNDVCSSGLSLVSYELLEAIDDVIAALNFSESKRIIKDNIDKLKKIISSIFESEILSETLEKIYNSHANHVHLQEEIPQNEFIMIEDNIKIDLPICEENKLIGRNDDFEKAECKILYESKVLMISGDFRIGKTSFIKCLEKRLSSKYDFLTAKIDFSNELVSSISAITNLLLKKIKKSFTIAKIDDYQTDKIKQVVKKIAKVMNGINVAGWGVTFNSNEIGTDLEDQFQLLNDFFIEIDGILIKKNKKIIIIIDEYTRLKNNDYELGKTIDALFRGLLQNSKNIYLILSGQDICDVDYLDNTATLATISYLLELQGWNIKHLKEYLESIKRLIVPDNVCFDIIEYTGGNPFWIKILLKELIKLLNEKRVYTVNNNLLKETALRVINDVDSQHKLNWIYRTVTTNNKTYEKILSILALKEDYTYSRSYFKNEIGEESVKALYDLTAKRVILVRNSKYAINNKLLKSWIKEYSS